MTQTERESLLEFVNGLSDEQWGTMTACDPWTVRHLVAHLTALGNQSFPNFAKQFIKAGFNFDKATANDLTRFNDGSVSDLQSRFAKSVSSPTTVPGPAYVPLGEFMIHGEDIRRAVGVRGEHPAAHIAALGPAYVKTGAPLRGKKRVEGLSLRATDSDWAFGSGPEVAGPGIDLLMAVSGRGDALDHCEGEGVATMRSRC